MVDAGRITHDDMEIIVGSVLTPLPFVVPLNNHTLPFLCIMSGYFKNKMVHTLALIYYVYIRKVMKLTLGQIQFNRHLVNSMTT